VWAAAPGQAAVLYDGAHADEVLGGGRIARPAPAGGAADPGVPTDAEEATSSLALSASA
jgi:hypothetical protein